MMIMMIAFWGGLIWIGMTLLKANHSPQLHTSGAPPTTAPSEPTAQVQVDKYLDLPGPARALKRCITGYYTRAAALHLEPQRELGVCRKKFSVFPGCPLGTHEAS